MLVSVSSRVYVAVRTHKISIIHVERHDRPHRGGEASDCSMLCATDASALWRIGVVHVQDRQAVAPPVFVRLI